MDKEFTIKMTIKEWFEQFTNPIAAKFASLESQSQFEKMLIMEGSFYSFLPESINPINDSEKIRGLFYDYKAVDLFLLEISTKYNLVREDKKVRFFLTDGIVRINASSDYLYFKRN